MFVVKLNLITINQLLIVIFAVLETKLLFALNDHQALSWFAHNLVWLPSAKAVRIWLFVKPKSILVLVLSPSIS